MARNKLREPTPTIELATQNPFNPLSVFVDDRGYVCVQSLGTNLRLTSVIAERLAFALKQKAKERVPQ